MRSTRLVPRLACLAVSAALALGGGVAVAAPASVSTSAAHRSSTSSPAAIARVVLRRLNRERAAHGRRRLTVSHDLVHTATRHSTMMASRREFEHQVRGEHDLATRVSRSGYRWHYLGENIAYSSHLDRAAALHLVRLWYRETPPDNGHRHNILARYFRNVGVGVVLEHHRLWLTVDFGRR